MMSSPLLNNNKPNYLKGTLFALCGPIIGIVLHIAIYSVGFIASTASFALAWLTVYLYRRGAGSIDKKSVFIIVGIIASGLILSILSLIAADLMLVYLDKFKDLNIFSVMFSTNYWEVFGDSILHNGEMWNKYLFTIYIAIIFSTLGSYRMDANYVRQTTP